MLTAASGGRGGDERSGAEEGGTQGAQEPRVAGGLWFFTEPGEGGWAAHLPEKQPPHPPQHSRRYGLLSSSPVPGTGQLY